MESQDILEQHSDYCTGCLFDKDDVGVLTYCKECSSYLCLDCLGDPEVHVCVWDDTDV